MTWPAAFSLMSAVISGLVALGSLSISRGPGARELRWFAAASTLACLFSSGNMLVGLPVSDLAIERAARFTLFVAAPHGAAWVLYDAEESRRRLTSFEQVLVGLSLIFACLALVPGVLVSPVVVARTAWFGLVYRDALPTPLGTVAYGYYCLSMLVLMVRYARRVWTGDRRPVANLVGITALAVAAVSDSLAAAQVTRMPYLLDFAFVTMVVAVGGSLVRRFVETAQALERSASRLAATQRELVQRERLAALGEMSAVVAHEVRNPLAVMFNALASLRRTRAAAATPSEQELMDILGEEAERLRRLVDDFLDFARPLTLRPDEVPVPGLLASAAEAARTAVPAASEVRVEANAGPPLATWDAQLLRVALVNLMANALQADAGRAGVEVVARSAGDRVLVEVVDHGGGVPSANVDRLFSPFFTTRAKGTGLGLSVVRRIAEAHGGTVAHRPTPGGGATFVLDLPRVAAPRS